jgi:hypothetical protein
MNNSFSNNNNSPRKAAALAPTAGATASIRNSKGVAVPRKLVAVTRTIKGQQHFTAVTANRDGDQGVNSNDNKVHIKHKDGSDCQGQLTAVTGRKQQQQNQQQQ